MSLTTWGNQQRTKHTLAGLQSTADDYYWSHFFKKNSSKDLTRSFWLSLLHLWLASGQKWCQLTGRVKDPFLHKPRQSWGMLNYTRRALKNQWQQVRWKCEGFGSKRHHCVGKEHNTDHPSVWASATAVSLHADWPHINFQCLYVTTKRCTRFSCSKGNREEWAWLKTFAQHCRLGVWANMLTEQAVPQKSPIFKWILEVKRQSTMLMYRCGAVTRPAVALVSQNLPSSGCLCVCLWRRRAMEAQIHFIWWKKKGRTMSEGFFLFSHPSSDPSNQPFVCVC